MPLIVAEGLDAQRVLLVALGERDDRPRHGCREQQGAAFLRRGIEDLFKLLAEAHVEHLVGLVEHRHAQGRQVERAAFQMIAKPSGRADDDVRAACQCPALLHRVHSTDAGDDARAGVRVEPVELLADLDRELAGRRDNQCERPARPGQPRRLEQLLAPSPCRRRRSFPIRSWRTRSGRGRRPPRR